MKKIPIYKAEAAVEGLVARIQASQSIAYAAQLQPVTDVDLAAVRASLSEDFLKAHANLQDNDLYPTRSILVTSNWNLNDDVFDKVETWSARHTPAHKPTNLGHDEHQLVGHMTDNWVIDEAGGIVADSTLIDDVPDVFHIVNAAVIYTTWSDQALIDRTQKLISEIEAGTKFVSMECLFSNFSYAVISPDGKYYTLARSEDTAFLTKHLRVYGGTGVFNDHKIGRLPRNIVFSAKGYVNEPGNPDSIIFSSANKFLFSEATPKNPFSTDSGVSILIEEDTHPNKSKAQETLDMSADIYKEQAEKADAKVVSLEAKLEELSSQYSKAGVDKLDAEIDTLTEQVAELTAERDELATAKKTAEQGKTDADKQIEELTATRDELQTKVTEAEAAAQTSTRIAQLVEAGSKADAAAAQVEKFMDLSDEQWAVVAESLVAAFNFGKDDDKDKKDKKKKDAKASKEGSEEGSDEEDEAGEGNADEAALAKAKADEEAALSAKADESSDDDVAAQTRKELSAAIAHRLGHDTSDESDDD